MIQRVTTADPVLDHITRPIIERFHPNRIILFGSRARGNAREDSDYDVMVELETELSDYECLTRLYAAVPHPRGFELNIFLRAPGRLEERRDDPGTVDWSIAREGIVLYSADGGSAGLLPSWPGRVRERGSQPPPSLAEWLKNADVDLGVIELILQNGRSPQEIPWGAVAFHAQQAAEKYLKAVLVARWKEAPRTHDLAAIVAGIRAAGAAVPDLTAQCQLLEPYAVDVRYPDDLAIPDEETGRAALQAAREIIAAARELLQTP